MEFARMGFVFAGFLQRPTVLANLSYQERGVAFLDTQNLFSDSASYSHSVGNFLDLPILRFLQ